MMFSSPVVGVENSPDVGVEIRATGDVSMSIALSGVVVGVLIVMFGSMTCGATIEEYNCILCVYG